MIDIAKVADDADMIVNGYAFTKDGQNNLLYFHYKSYTIIL